MIGEDLECCPSHESLSSFHSVRNLELESVCEQLEHCQTTRLAEVSSLTQQLRETERQLEAMRRAVEGTGGDSRDPRRGARKAEGEREKTRAERRIERLQSRLKTQVEQSNYLRVKLGTGHLSGHHSSVS